ncbi:alpha/beta fold hydrolase, partial [Streptomyces sp. NPDC055722]
NTRRGPRVIEAIAPGQRRRPGFRAELQVIRLVSEQVAPRFEHCDIAHVSGAGHWSHVEQPAAVARMLTDFVNKSVTV